MSIEKNLKIPSSVLEIGDYAFCGCSLETVSLPISVEYVGKCAFLNRYDDIEEGEEVFYSWAGPYYGNSCLKIVRLSPKMKIIEDKLFCGCKDLMSVYIPYGIECIGISAFEDCEELIEIIIPASVKVIKKNAFYGCSSLSNIVIPDSVTAIGKGAFSGCSLLYDFKQELISRFGEEIFG